MRTMAPKPASTQTSAAASKIKNKILNTSSFFKISLKNNNKALALALEAQKERSRQLEREIVYLQKQVKALYFELATKKYKHRKLLLILKSLHSNTLQHFNIVADLISDSDLSKLPEDDQHTLGDTDKENFVMGSLSDQFPPQTAMAGTPLCPFQKLTADLPEEKICANVFNVQNRSQTNTEDNTDAGERQYIQPFQSVSSHSCSNLRDEVQRLSVMLSQSGFDIKSVLCPQNNQIHSGASKCEQPKPSLSDDAHILSCSVMETDPEHCNKQEKTVLLNATMEMTLSNATEIVTVESKAKKTGRSDKPKCKKNKEQACELNEAENPHSRSSDIDSAPAGASLQTDGQTLEDIGETEVKKLQPPNTQCTSVIISRIPRLNNYQADNHRKRTKDKLKPHSLAKSKPGYIDTVATDLEDYFTDSNMTISKAREHTLESDDEPLSKITCRRVRTKEKKVSSVTRKTAVTLPLEEECVDNIPQRKIIRAKECQKPRGREGSMISDNPLSNTATLEVGATEQDALPLHCTRLSDCEGEEPSTVTHATISQDSESLPHRHSDGHLFEETQSSCKHPWLATHDLGSPEADFCTNYDHNTLLLEQGCASEGEFPKSKKARSKSLSSKKTAVRRVVCSGNLSGRKKREQSSNKGLGSKDEACYLEDHIDDPEINKEQVQVADSHSDLNGKDCIFEHSNSRISWTPKRCRNSSKLHSPIESRNLRETFVVYRRKTQDSVSLNNMRTADVSHAFSHMDTGNEAICEDLGGLLMNEMPPWLAIDDSTADTEMGSVIATPRTPCRVALIEESAAVTTEASPGRVLTSLTNTISTPDDTNGGRSRRGKGVVSYKEPSLNSKIRRGDKFTESTFLSSPVFKGGKKRQKKTSTTSSLKRASLLD